MVKVSGRGFCSLCMFKLFIIIFYFIWLLGQDINWYIVLSPAPVAIFIYFLLLCFSFANVFYILIYILPDSIQQIH